MVNRLCLKIIYDDNAIYIGAYSYDSEPQKIQRQLSARDAQMKEWAAKSKQKKQVG